MMCIRRVKKEDSKKLLEIYSYYILHTAITFEISVPSLKEFEERIEAISKRYPYLVLEDEGEIKGYAYAYYLKDREAYNHSVEVTIYLEHNNLKKGYGRTLYEALEENLLKEKITNLYACIGDPIGEDEFLDNNSELFHSHLGYKKVGTFHDCGRKFGHSYNVIWMEKILKEPSK